MAVLLISAPPSNEENSMMALVPDDEDDEEDQGIDDEEEELLHDQSGDGEEMQRLNREKYLKNLSNQKIFFWLMKSSTY